MLIVNGAQPVILNACTEPIEVYFRICVLEDSETSSE